MAAVFILCVRNGPLNELEILLGPKLDGKKNDQGLTVPAGQLRNKKESRIMAAIREFREETGIVVSEKRFHGFRIESGDYWFLVYLNGEKPKSDPEHDKSSRAVWGPANFYQIQKLSELPIARWQKKNLIRAIKKVGWFVCRWCNKMFESELGLFCPHCHRFQTKTEVIKV